MEEEKVILKLQKQNKIKLAYNFSNLNSEGPLGVWGQGSEVILWFSWILHQGNPSILYFYHPALRN